MMTFKLFLNITCLVMVVCFFVPWITIPLLGENLSAVQILGHAKELDNPFVYSLYAFLAATVLTLIGNQWQTVSGDIAVAIGETVSVLLLLLYIGFILYYNGESIIKITDVLTVGAYVSFCGLGILSYDLFANQMKKYRV